MTRTRVALAVTVAVVAAAVVAAGLVATLAQPAGDGGAGPVANGHVLRVVPPTASTSLPAPAPLPPPALGWSSCGPARQCSTLVVPLDYARPSGPTIGIALARRRAPTAAAARIGSLVLDPGGPGESGIANLDKDVSVLPPGVLARFDVVAFDARGIGGSEPMHCQPAPGPPPDPVPQDPAAQRALLAADVAYATACATSTGPLLAHMGTVDVARDLEQLRVALGDPGLTYLGLSYGSLVGATYASLFPTHVRAMALDGILDPSLTMAQLADAQAVGFEHSLDAFFSWCASAPGACGWHPPGDPRAAFRALVAGVRLHHLGTGSAAVGPNELYTGTFGALYARSFWPSLATALAGVARGDPAPMRALFDGYERTGDPSFNTDANNAITCLDHPTPADPSVYPARATAAGSAAPDFGPLFAWGALLCAVWPVPASAQRSPAPVRADGAPPILVVGTTGDPATPYAWAQSLATQLAGAVLLTRAGVDHVAIFTSSCVRSYDDAYLVSLRLPPPATVCPA